MVKHFSQLHRFRPKTSQIDNRKKKKWKEKQELHSKEKKPENSTCELRANAQKSTWKNETAEMNKANGFSDMWTGTGEEKDSEKKRTLTTIHGA